jgi:hypothetical protein
MRWARPFAVRVLGCQKAGDARPRGVGQIATVAAPMTEFRVT